jgi:error-prone DNA polymerase
MGLRYVKGLGEPHGRRIETARSERPFSSVEDLAERTGLGSRVLARLAEGGALAGLERDRRAALWRARGAVHHRRPELAIECVETTPAFEALDPLATIDWDFAATGHSPRGHPLEPLRTALTARQLPDARSVSAMHDGAAVRYAGIVICRQRPGTASGVVFMTLEDETGFVNVVVWSRVFDEYAALIKTTSFLGVTGKLQVQDGVVHVVARRFWIPRLCRPPSAVASHDFR